MFGRSCATPADAAPTTARFAEHERIFWVLAGPTLQPVPGFLGADGTDTTAGAGFSGCWRDRHYSRCRVFWVLGAKCYHELGQNITFDIDTSNYFDFGEMYPNIFVLAF